MELSCEVNHGPPWQSATTLSVRSEQKTPWKTDFTGQWITTELLHRFRYQFSSYSLDSYLLPTTEKLTIQVLWPAKPQLIMYQVQCRQSEMVYATNRYCFSPLKSYLTSQNGDTVTITVEEKEKRCSENCRANMFAMLYLVLFRSYTAVMVAYR